MAPMRGFNDLNSSRGGSSISSAIITAGPAGWLQLVAGSAHYCQRVMRLHYAWTLLLHPSSQARDGCNSCV